LEKERISCQAVAENYLPNYLENFWTDNYSWSLGPKFWQIGWSQRLEIKGETWPVPAEDYLDRK